MELLDAVSLRGLEGSMLTPEQRNALNAAMFEVENAEGASKKREASNAFRQLIAKIADEIGANECAVVLTDRYPLDPLNREKCEAMLDFLEMD